MARRQKRRWAPRSEGKKEARIHVRVPNRIHDQLARAATRNGWTISAEVIHRLGESFALSETPAQALMTMIAYSVDGLHGPGTWMDDPYLHQQAHDAVQAAFKLVQPEGYPPVTQPDLLEGRPNGRIALEMLWDEVRRYDPKRPIDATRPRAAQHQRRLAKLRTGLGPLPDRIVLWGVTGKEARRRQAALAVDELREFAQLANRRVTDGLSPDEHARFVALYSRHPRRKMFQLGTRSDPNNLSNPGPFPDLEFADEEESGVGKEEKHT
jgi:hypothetical protein